MNGRTTASIVACALALAASGCGIGGDDDSIRNAGPNPNDKRGVALSCIKGEDVPATLIGEKSIQVDGPTGPRIEFFVSSGEAEARQFQGEAQGAEQVGAALLFVNQGNDEVLKKIEDCLAKQ
jgi:hypothetical protein